MRRAVVTAAVISALAVACGARTQLLAPHDDESAFVDASVDDTDAAVDDAATDGSCVRDTDCDDGVACTVDTCNAEGPGCKSTPDNSRCPVSQLCDPSLGCVALAFAVDRASLYDIRLPNAHYTLIGATNVLLTDIALHPDNVLYGINGTALFTVDQNTGAATQIASVPQGLNALDVAPDGTLYGAGGGTLYQVDRKTGKATPLVAFPPGTISSGDLAFVGPRLLAAAKTNADDALVELDLAQKTSRIVGPIGATCIYGLAAYGVDLYGFSCNGEVLSINADTGVGTLITQNGIHFDGASAR
jgi:hypothetical protein